MIGLTSILDATVYHKRHTPVVYKFAHKVIFLVLNLQQINNLPKTRFFSINKFNIFSLSWNRYGFRDFTDPKDYIINLLAEFKLPQRSIKKIYLITMPKVLGYVFNPVSFWLCFDEADSLYIVLAEVNNTFGERYGYLCYNQDHSPILSNSKICKTKLFHVSPFCKVMGSYEFRFNITSDNINIEIDYCINNSPIITTSINGINKNFNDFNFLKYFLIYPFMTFKVVWLIHYHAFRLWLKKVAYYKKPNPPNVNIS